MQQTPASPSPHVPDFEGLLAAIARPAPNSGIDEDDGSFADDIATLSYESALRTHARYRLCTAIDPARVRASDGLPMSTDQANSTAPRLAGLGMKSSDSSRRAQEQDRKSASITIRLSEEERGLLLQRAAEAELTISAYLRSCTLEVETLRTQVKDALTALRKSSARTERMVEREGRDRRSHQIKLFDRSGSVGRIWSSLFHRRPA